MCPRLLWLPFTVFVVSGLLVLSFVLFEVLDIDESDFPRPGAAQGQWASLGESVHDLRRTLLVGDDLRGASSPLAPAVAALPGHAPLRERLPGHHGLLIRRARQHRNSLPRASIPSLFFG